MNATETITEANLVERTRELLEASTETLPTIAIGSDVSFYWLRRFKSGEAKRPDAASVEKVYRYLSA